MYRNGQKIPIAERPLDCRECRSLEYYPDKKCCFNCKKYDTNCEALHYCGEDCPEWVSDAKPFNMTPKELKDTKDMMISSDYTERFKAEYYQLKIRYEKLKNMLKQWVNGSLEYTPSSRIEIFNIQFSSMSNYLIALEMRAKDEGIVLEKGD